MTLSIPHANQFIFTEPINQLLIIFRCSGVNYCSFILNQDVPGAKDWGNGTVSITYACVSGKGQYNTTPPPPWAKNFNPPFMHPGDISN